MSDKRTVLAVDVGGSHVKVLRSGETESRRAPSGPTLTAAEMVAAALEAANGWAWDVVTVGVPAPVHGGRVASEPFNLGQGWVGFDFEAAFGAPTKVINDAAMQALGSYEGGTMLFLGLGTGLGSALIADGISSRWRSATCRSRKAHLRGLPRRAGAARSTARSAGRSSSRKRSSSLSAALEPDYVVLGGGNATKLDQLPLNARLGSNSNAFTGGFRAWDDAGSTAKHSV